MRLIYVRDIRCLLCVCDLSCLKSKAEEKKKAFAKGEENKKALTKIKANTPEINK